MNDFTTEELENLNGITSSRHGFILPFSVMELIRELPTTQKGIVIEAIDHFLTTSRNDYAGLKQGTLSYFTFKQFMSQYKKDAAKWLAKSKVNKENGKKGGSVPRHNKKTGEVLDSDKHPIYG